MSNTQDTTETPAPEAADAPQTDAQTTEAPESTERENAPENGNREAAKYRTRLREAEAERDGIRADLDGARQTVERLQRALVETTAAEALLDPADLWRHGGADLPELLTDDGVPDPEKVGAVVQSILTERRHLAKPRSPKPDMTQGGTGQAPVPVDPVGAYLSGQLS
ncbi:hypothetical protein V3N95_03835 [Micrococcaceae bacterium Sec6.3]